MNTLTPRSGRLTISIIFLVTLILPFFKTENTANAAEKILTFLNWAEYMDPELIAEFERQYDVKIRLITYESDDARTQMLLSTGGGQFDVAVVDGESLEAYSKRGWLEEINPSTVPNVEYIHPKWKKAYPTAARYAVPYFWGTTGIAYRSDLVSAPITSWMQLYKPAEELRGKIYMLPQSRELIDISLKALGYSINTSDPAPYREVEKLLKEQKEYVKKYDVLALNENSALVKGDVVAAMTYNGDAVALSEVDENIVYVAPEEGGTLWVDYLVILANGKNKKIAEAFINFLNIPKNAAQLAQFVYYATPNTQAERLLPEDFKKDSVIYPSEKVLNRYEIGERIPPKIQRIRATIFSEVTSGKI